MGRIHKPDPVLLILAAFSRYEAALEWARQRAEHEWGALAHVSETFAFSETEYYAPSMGADLKKLFLAFAQGVDPGQLPEVKRLTNQWETEYAERKHHPESRPLNVDPGYLTLGKLVLASTKDHAHRIYLADGIYAEVTLQYTHGNWQASAWTFPDYRRADYHEFFSRCRQFLYRELRRDTTG